VLASDSVTVWDPMGDIEYYRYDYPGGTQQITPQRMAYNHGYNPQDANRGSSIVSSIILELNIDLNLKRFLQSFFSNDAMPGMVGSPETSLPPKEWQELKELLKQHYKGVGNRRRSLMLPFKFNFEVMDEPDIQKHYSLHEPMRQEIFAAFGVPLVLVGDNTSTPYKDADNVLANFINLRVKSIALDIQTFNNDSCLPWLDHSGTTRFEFDFSQYALPSEADTTRVTIGTSEYQGEIATLNEAREQAGLPTLEGGDIFKSGKSIDDLKSKPAPIVTITKPAPALLSAVTAHSVSVDGHGMPVRTWVLDNPDSLQTAQLAELEAWERFLKARQGKASVRAFNVDYLRGSIGDELQAALTTGDYKAAFKTAREKLAIRDIQATRLQFEDAFDTAIRSALSGDMNRLTWGNEMRRIVRRGINAAYRDGLKAGGVEDEPDETEQDAIATLFEDQREYINSLAVALFKDETVSQSMADQKPAMWWGKSIQPAYYAGFNSAAGNQMVEFVGDDGEESCETCQKLKGQRHRLKDWTRKALIPQQDGESYICGGWRCAHLLAAAQGKAQGNWI
jgi:HK97 family phage portal protein